MTLRKQLSLGSKMTESSQTLWKTLNITKKEVSSRFNDIHFSC